MEYTKGEIAGGWIHVSHGERPIALVHPKYVDKFLAAPQLYEALERLMVALEKHGSTHNDVRVAYNLAKPAIAKAAAK